MAPPIEWRFRERECMLEAEADFTSGIEVAERIGMDRIDAEYEPQLVQAWEVAIHPVVRAVACVCAKPPSQEELSAPTPDHAGMQRSFEDVAALLEAKAEKVAERRSFAEEQRKAAEPELERRVAELLRRCPWPEQAWLSKSS
jgi:hypothetical protein